MIYSLAYACYVNLAAKHVLIITTLALLARMSQLEVSQLINICLETLVSTDAHTYSTIKTIIIDLVILAILHA